LLTHDCTSGEEIFINSISEQQKFYILPAVFMLPIEYLPLYTIRARTGPIWIMFALSGLPGLILLFTEPEIKGGWFLFLASSLFCLFLYIDSKYRKIEISEEALTYFAYGKKRSMRWEEIVATKIAWEIEGGHSASYNWRFFTVNKKEINIPLGYYARPDMQLLASQVNIRAINATLSDSVFAIAGGKFPWFLF
jgi:hypothetical protein